MFAEVILPLNLKGTFTYRVPDILLQTVQPGMRVLVPFRGRKIYTGIVFTVKDELQGDFVPKEIISALDSEPILPPEQLQFWDWMSQYYLCNIGEIYRFAFPASLKLESETYLKLKPYANIDFENLDVNEMYLIQALEVRQLVNLSEIEAFIPKKDVIKTVNSLINLQYIEIDEKIAEKYRVKEAAYLKLKNPEAISSQLPQFLLQLKNAPKQQEILLHLVEKHTENPELPVRKSTLLEEGHYAPAQITALVGKGLVEEFYLAQDRLQSYTGETEALDGLSEAQRQASAEISKSFGESKNVLLHGVTGSGKTHLYLEKIAETVSDGKNALVLLPEISLTKQITQRLEKKYGKKLGFYHQKLTDFERVEVWRKIKNNELNIIIGTRNAIFLPFQNLGIIIVDEEHDSGYRPREVSPYFNAKDASLILADIYNAKVILGSATPSLESYWLSENGKLNYVALNERYGGVKMPTFEIVNLQEAQNTKNIQGNFTVQAIEHIQHQLDDSKQVMILHNRRGYANVVECESCGYVSYCANCDVVMTYHKFSNELKCHYCGHKSPKPEKCPKCMSENLNTRGIGVEQIHEEVEKIFPGAEVDRMDVESMRRKFAFEKLYEKIEGGETDIIVGTQMISKGLDFDHIELVVVPRADQMMYIQDFRAEERAYQLLMQVSGRAGRVSGEGKLIIQTYNPQHPVFELIGQNDCRKVYQHLLDERKKFHYPPFTKTVLVELKHRKEDKVQRASQFLGAVLRKYLPEQCILGPEKSPVGKINLLYQYQILLKLPRGRNYGVFKKALEKSLEEFSEVTAYQSIKKEIFVDY